MREERVRQRMKTFLRVGIALIGFSVFTIGCPSDPEATPSDDAGAIPPPGACGRTSTPCPPGGTCEGAPDCASNACKDGLCQAVEPPNNTQNNDETDVDCGGTKAPACPDGKKCIVASDCISTICKEGVCAAPSPTDGIKNGGETGIDCGGPNAPKCGVGQGCASNDDCDNLKCGDDKTCIAASATDGVKNNGESDVDCGGANAPKCEPGKTCNDDNDCANTRCNTTSKKCDPPSAGDGLKNGSETDVDCGGGAPTNAPACAIDKSCAAHTDCASSACAISGPKAGKCVPAKSCVKNDGGYTCGRDDRDFGGATFNLESCCATAPLAGTNVRIDRFAITAGRMRAFIERFNGNIRGYVQGPNKPAGWQAAWDNLVPSNVAEAEDQLGPYWVNAPNDPNVTAEKFHSKRSCGYDNYNGHTYWVSTNQAAQNYTQAQLDAKVLNCVGWHIVRAFCGWEGGHIATVAELRNAFTNGNTTTYPWGNAAYNPDNQDPRLNHKYNYGQPGGTPGNNRITWWLSPPGRFYQGWNQNGVEIAGNVLHWTGDAPYNFAWNYSFENHNGTFNNGGDWRSPNDRSDVPNGYYALGARCAYP